MEMISSAARESVANKETATKKQKGPPEEGEMQAALAMPTNRSQ